MVPKNITDYQLIINKLNKNYVLTLKDLNSIEIVFKTWIINLGKLEKSLNTDTIKTDVMNYICKNNISFSLSKKLNDVSCIRFFIINYSSQ